MPKSRGHKFTRRDFLKGSLAVGGLLVAQSINPALAHAAAGGGGEISRSRVLPESLRSGRGSQDPPNIIVILADDLGYGDVGCFGSQAIRTPHLDQMAAEGVRMTSFYASAPLCSPSRAGLLTGRYPVRTGITMPFYPSGSLMDGVCRVGGVYSRRIRGIAKEEMLLPEVLRERGYRTGMVGKWHLGDRTPHLPNEQGV